MKTTLFLGFGLLFWVFGAPTRIQTLKKRQSGGGERDYTPGAELPDCRRAPPARAARPLVHKILAML